MFIKYDRNIIRGIARLNFKRRQSFGDIEV